MRAPAMGEGNRIDHHGLNLVTSGISARKDELAPQNQRLQLGAESVRRKLTTQGNQFFPDGQPFKMWGLRTDSAAKIDAQTDHLIAQLDEYLGHGVNADTVFYMGSSDGGRYVPDMPPPASCTPRLMGWVLNS